MRISHSLPPVGRHSHPLTSAPQHTAAPPPTGRGAPDYYCPRGATSRTPCADEEAFKAELCLDTPPPPWSAPRLADVIRFAKMQKVILGVSAFPLLFHCFSVVFATASFVVLVLVVVLVVEG